MSIIPVYTYRMSREDIIKHWRRGARDALAAVHLLHKNRRKFTAKPPTKASGIAIARRMKQRLKAHGIPVVDIYLFGSLAAGKPHRWSDVDIAVIHDSFEKSRAKERRKVRSMREDFDVPIDIICLHPEDLHNRFLGIANEVRERGLLV